jgi:hypothetical protein
MKATAQILELDVINKNGRLYRKDVIKDAVKSLGTLSVGILPHRAFLESSGVPTVNQSVGDAKKLRIDPATNHLLADINIDKIPDDLKGGFVIRPAGVGRLLPDGTVTDYQITALVLTKD